MSLAPGTPELIARARSDLRMGMPVVFTGPQGAALFIATETLTPTRLEDVVKLGVVDLVVTAQRAQTLNVAAYDGDLVRIALPPAAPLSWVQAVADPADDLLHPMKGPFLARREGRADLHRAGIRLAKAARLIPAGLVVAIADPNHLTSAFGLTSLPSQDVLNTDLSPLRPVIHARVPLDVSEAGRVHVFRPEDGAQEHYAAEIGQPDRSQPVLARLHSACFTGDVLGSLKCDCGPQLRGALRQMGDEGAGVLLYLNQEGRGIGLANKMRAYSLQDQGFDTVEANHRLGFEDDERDFRIGADILKSLGFRDIRLLTNNPAKVARLQDCGLRVVERVPLKVGKQRLNQAYLETKAKKSGHLL